MIVMSGQMVGVGPLGVVLVAILSCPADSYFQTRPGPSSPGLFCQFQESTARWRLVTALVGGWNAEQFRAGLPPCCGGGGVLTEHHFSPPPFRLFPESTCRCQTRCVVGVGKTRPGRAARAGVSPFGYLPALRPFHQIQFPVSRSSWVAASGAGVGCRATATALEANSTDAPNDPGTYAPRRSSQVVEGARAGGAVPSG